MGNTSSIGGKVFTRNFIFFVISFILLLPVFFINYRMTAFHTLPFDSYYSFLVAMDGKDESFEFYAPTGYRMVYMGVAYFFYKYMPFVPLSQIAEGANFFPIKALQSLAFTSFLFLHLFYFTSFIYVQNKLKKSFILSLATAGVCFLFALSMYYFGVDPLYLFYTTLLLYFIDKKYIFIPLLLFSIIVNEKISLIFLVFFSITVLSKSSRRESYVPLIASALAFMSYFLMKMILKFPGYEYQTDLTSFYDRLQISIPFLTSFKGFYVNILPVVLLSSIAIAAAKMKVFDSYSLLRHWATGFLPIIFFILGLHACSDYGIGRAAMHALPFFIAPMVFMLDKINTMQSELNSSRAE